MSIVPCEDPGAPGSGEPCGRPSVAHRKCAGHYAQARRGQAPLPLKQDVSPGPYTQISVRLSVALKEEIEFSAREQGIELADFYRLAIKAYLRRRK